MRKTKIQVLSYKCKNCQFSKDFLSYQEINTKCKVCGNEMVFYNSRNYNPDESLRAMKASKHKVIQDTPSTPTVTCPYCQSIDTKKITNTSKAVHTALFGIFAMGRNAKEWHCCSCKSDF